MQEKNQFDQIVGKHVENWIPRNKPAKNNLIGSYCTLEPLSIEKHARFLYDALHNDNHLASWTYLPYGPFATFEIFNGWLKEKLAEDSTLLYAIISNISKLPVGISAYLRTTEEHGAIEIGHLNFSNLLKRTPAATETIYLMLKLVFDELHYRRCEWKCNSLNQASHAAALRFGFKFEGIFRQHNVFKERNRDTAWFSILDHEWPALKEKYIQWLDPNNFDVNGKQIQKLSEI